MCIDVCGKMLLTLFFIKSGLWTHFLSLRIYPMYIRYRYNIGEICKTMATKPTDVLSRYVVGQIYIFEKQWLKSLLFSKT